MGKFLSRFSGLKVGRKNSSQKPLLKKGFLLFSVFLLIAVGFAAKQFAQHRAKPAQAAATFAAPVNYAAGTNPESIFNGDFNNDGSPDFVVGNVNSNTVSVYINDGTGNYAAAVPYSVGTNPFGVYGADFNSDGYIDLVSGNFGSDNISVLMNNGNGTFAAAVNYSTGAGNDPAGVFSADLNKDGYPDIAVADRGANNVVSIFINNGAGLFAPAVSVDNGAEAYSITGADFDNDGDVDLAMADLSAGYTSVLINNGDATFQPPVNYFDNAPPFYVTAGDFDRDGRLDLVAALPSGGIDVFRNFGSFFSSPTNYPTAVGSQIGGVTVGDLDNDGDPDIIAADQNNHDVIIFLNNGSGTFDAGTTYAAPSPRQVFVADVDHDGDLDIGAANVTNNNVSILINNGANTGTGNFTVVNKAVGNGQEGVVSEDFNADGFIDLAVSNDFDNTVSILFNQGDGTFGSPQNYAVDTPIGLISADFDGNGSKDLAVPDSSDATVSVLLNDGFGNFSSAVTYPVGTNPEGIFAGDLNHDGKVDLAVGNWFDGNVSVLMGVGDGTFTAATNYTVGTNPNTVVGGDFNRDGKIDLAVSNGTSNNFSVLINNGDGTFAAAINHASGGTNPQGIFAADLNNDGKIDLALSDADSNDVSIFFGVGDGTFVGADTYPSGTGPGGIVGGDFNNDGHIDLAEVNETSNDTSVLLNNGDGTFAAPVSYGGGDSPFAIAAGDFNRDGQLDLASANINGGNLNLLYNAGAPVAVQINSIAQIPDGNGFVHVSFQGTGSSSMTLTSLEYSKDGGATWTPISDGSAALVSGWPGPFATGTDFGTAPVNTFDVYTQHIDLQPVNRVDIPNFRVRFKGKVGFVTSAFATSANLHLDNKPPFPVRRPKILNRPTAGDTHVNVDPGAVSDESGAAGMTNQIEVATLGGTFGPSSVSIDGGSYGSPTNGDSNTFTPANLSADSGGTFTGESKITGVRTTATDAMGNRVQNETAIHGGFQVEARSPLQPYFNDPSDLVIGQDGTLWVTNRSASELIRFDTTNPGVDIRIGGPGTDPGFLNNPRGLAVDSNGVLYEVDNGNSRVQKFNSEGEFISTFGVPGSGNGQFSSPFGVAVGPDGSIYVADVGNQRIQKFANDGTFILAWGTPGAGNGQFNGPEDVAIDPTGTYLLVADHSNNRIQKFDTSGNWIASFGQDAEPCGFFPEAVSIDAANNYYSVDRSSHRVDKFNSAGVFQFALGGENGCGNTEGDGKFAAPEGDFVDAGGHVWVADTSNERIQEMNGTDGSFIAKWGAGRDDDNGYFYGPASIASDSAGNIYTTETSDPRVQKFDSNANFLTKWGTIGNGPGQFNYNLNGITADPLDNIFVADSGNDRIEKFTSSGAFLTQWGSTGSANGQFNFPFKLASDSSGNIYVVDYNNSRIQKFDNNGVFITAWGTLGAGDGQFTNPQTIAIDNNLGEVFVSDVGVGGRIQKFTTSGVFIQSFIDADGTPTTMVVDSHHNIYAAGAQTITRINNNGTQINTYTSNGGDVGQFQGITGIALDPSGRLLVADGGPVGQGRIQVFSGFPAVTPAVPFAPDADPLDGAAHVKLNFQGGENNDQYAFKFSTGTDNYAQLDNTLGPIPFFQSRAAWGGSSGTDITGLNNGTSYDVSAAARNKSGDDPETTYGPVTSVTPGIAPPPPPPPPPPGSGGGISPETAPAAPTTINIQALSTTSLRANFSDNANNEEGFNLQQNGSNLVQSGTPNLSYLDYAGLTANTQYSGPDSAIYPCAYNNTGTTCSSSSYAPTYTLIDPPTDIQFSNVGPTSVMLNALGDFPNLSADQSGLFFEQISGPNSGWIQSTSTTFSELQPDTDYSFRVKARNGDGIETTFAVANIHTAQTNAAQLQLILSAGVNDNTQLGPMGQTIEAMTVDQIAGYFEKTSVALSYVLSVLAVTGLISLIGTIRSGKRRQKKQTVNRWKLRADEHFLAIISLLIVKAALIAGLVLYGANVPAQAALSGNGEPVKKGDFITYQLDYSNVGGSTANDLVLEIPIPDMTTYAGPMTSGTVSGAASPITFNMGSLPPGTSGSVQVKVQVTTQPTQDSDITNRGQATSDETGLVYSNVTSNPIQGTVNQPPPPPTPTPAPNPNPTPTPGTPPGTTPGPTGGSPSGVPGNVPGATIPGTTTPPSSTPPSNEPPSSPPPAPPAENQLLIPSIPGLESITGPINEVISNVGHVTRLVEPQGAAALVAISPLIAFVNPTIALNLPNLAAFFYYFFSWALSVFGLRRRRKPWGVAYDAITKEPISMAIVRLMRLVAPGEMIAAGPGAADASELTAPHPVLVETQVTDSQGRFGFLAKIGQYRLEVAKPGYNYPSGIVKTASDVQFEHVYRSGIINIKSAGEAVSAGIPLDPVNQEKELEKAKRRGMLNVLGFEIRRISEKVSLPFIVFGLIASALIMIADFTPVNATIFVLYTLFTIFQLVFTPKHAKPWGVVYDSVSLKPVPLVVVTIMDAKYNRILKSRLTDYDGRFSFLPPVGAYKIRVQKSGYVFPSQKPVTGHHKAYLGEEFEVTKDKETIDMDVPVDPAK